MNTLGNILVAVLVIALALTITLPDHVLDDVPGALGIKDFLRKTFSQTWDLAKQLFNTVYDSVRGTGSRLKNAVSEGYSSTYDTITAKLDAVRDLQDALDRLTN